MRTQVLVYVQAVPTSIPRSAKRFGNIELSEFRMTHSSKVALVRASQIKDSGVVAIGYAAVLNEALARGATSAISVPLCDNPVEQAKFFPQEKSNLILIGENPDGIFSGAALAGALSALRNIPVHANYPGHDAHQIDSQKESILIVNDDGKSLGNVDISRIRKSAESVFNIAGILGRTELMSAEPQSAKQPFKGEPKEIASMILKRLRRHINQE